MGRGCRLGSLGAKKLSWCSCPRPPLSSPLCLPLPYPTQVPCILLVSGRSPVLPDPPWHPKVMATPLTLSALWDFTSM